MAEKTMIVDTFTTGYAAQLAKDLLANEGIQGYLTGTDSVMPASSNGGFKLNVSEKDFYQALSILSSEKLL